MTDASDARPEPSEGALEPADATGPGPVESTTTRHAARARASELRALQQKKDRRNRWLLRGGVIGGILVVLGGIAFVLLTWAQPAARGPQNMQSDGILIGPELAAVKTPGIGPGEAPQPIETAAPEVAHIRLYVDYLSAGSGTFESVNGDQIESLVSSGAATVEIHPLALLSGRSAGTQYSSRAANAAACVAEFSPDSFFAFNRIMLAEQPVEGQPGFGDEELISRAQQAGASTSLVSTCIESMRFRGWVQAATKRAQDGPIPGSAVEGITETPVVLVNGTPYPYVADEDPAEFTQFIVRTAGDTFIESQLPSPSPSPSSGG
ncbi:DsbA family protein [Homoserinibacter sp. YIM 151385]|uniref:DsbA family protein n=1 Tax=Homoserinibacter sp. YIM 151385 TaxID=2985506 RepID=UPI0022F0CDCB|nr:thioredoxin domain-containing protein [Homoserinibacter sp. YIM 151385]WBU37847.1 thioredoxin domain-containing protein [Homoserinibacter sp. YIM 151385]